MPEFTDPLIIKDSSGSTGFHFDPTNGWLIVGSNGKRGNIAIKNSDDKIIFESASQDDVIYVHGNIIGRDFPSKIDTMIFSARRGQLSLGNQGIGGHFSVLDASKKSIFEVHSVSATIAVGNTGKPGNIWVRDGNNNNKIILDGNTGDITLAGADCAEDFDVADPESKDNIEAGTVMVLTENGSLQQSYQEYDKKVAGIVSGASGYKPGIILDRQDQDQDQKNKDRLSIALMGKVYCKVDARNSSIEIGDLLTTSSTKGYAMKAQDPMKAFGAVIGKALGSIKEGLGMIPVLVALQ
jgi:hypothetical protein